MVYILLIFIGLCLGSFVNALVWRLRQQELRSKSKLKQIFSSIFHLVASKFRASSSDELSIVWGHSMCSKCHHELSAKDLVPLLSWLTLRGKCRYCHSKIEDSPIIELVTAILFVMSYALWPFVLSGIGLYYFGFWLLFLVGFTALSVYDLRWFMLPNRIIFPLIGLALLRLAGAIIFYHAGWQSIITAFWGVAFASGIFYVLFQLSKGQWIGGGDVKLGIIIGLLLGGPMMSLLMLFVASSLGSLVGLPFLLTGKRKMRIPFGPFLLTATVFVTLWGATIIDWYKSSLGL